MESGIYPAGTIVDGRYRIEKRLGRGGFATVYQAEHLQLGRQAALKVLEPVAPHITERFQARFNTEARIAANLDHQNVVRIFDFGFIEPDDRPYIAMELLEGCDLEVYLKDAGPMEPERAKRLFLPVLDALKIGHERGIVHKDLKPSNLFFVKEGQPDEKLVVLDYGIARLEGDENPRFTEEGTYTGTPAYMPPEYIHRREVTPAYDVYQIGLIFIEAMTGQPVVVARSHMAYMVAHVEGKHHIPEGFGDTPLGAVLLHAIAVDPGERYANAGEMLDAVRSAEIAHGTIFSMPALPPGPEPGASRTGDETAHTTNRDAGPLDGKAKPGRGVPTGAILALFVGLLLFGCFVATALVGAFFMIADPKTEPPPSFGLDEIEPPAMPTIPNIAAYSSEGQEMNAWLLSRYMLLATLNQVHLYQKLLPKTGGWSSKGASFVPAGTEDLLGLASQQLQIGLDTAPQRVALEKEARAMEPDFAALRELLADLYDYHSVRRGWEADGGAHGKELTRRLANLTKKFEPRFANFSSLVDRELQTYLRQRGDALSGEPFLSLATEAMLTEHQLITTMAKDPGAAASNTALSKFDAALAALEKHIRAQSAALNERYQMTGGLHNNFLSALKDTRKQAGELRAEARKGEDVAGDVVFLWMQLHMTFDSYNQLQRF